MPELPEVETIVRELGQKIKNKKIKTIEVLAPKMVNFSVKDFTSKLKNRKIKKVDRRGKMIIIELDNKNYLLVHLIMTGQLVYRAKSGKIGAVGGHPIVDGLKKLPNKFTRVIFLLSDGSCLFFNDIRKFGWMKLVDKDVLDKTNKKFGIEPFTKEWTIKNFEVALKKYPGRKIKQSLLDQKIIAGVGNIYADESCFCAKIMPTRKISTLKDGEIKKLFSCLARVMKLSISKGGTSSDTYIRTDGSQGGFMPYLRVYGRKDEKCKVCKKMIGKIKLNGRGTHYCSYCQK